MTSTAKKPETSKNTTVAMLYKDFANLKTFVFYVGEEMDFFLKLLAAEIYNPDIPNLFENLQKFRTKVDQSKIEAEQWNSSLEEHKDQIRLLLGDQEKSVQDFYDNEHTALKDQVLAFINDSNNLKLDIFRYTGSLFLKD